jgi:hypothetical protein
MATPLLQRVARLRAPAASDDSRNIDADGFVHVRPTSQTQTSADEARPDLDRWVAEAARFIGGLKQAAQRDLAQLSRLE